MSENIVSHASGAEPPPKSTSPAFQFVIGLAMIVVLMIASVIVGQQESKVVAASAAAAATAAAATPAAATPIAETTPAPAGTPVEPAPGVSPATVAEAAPPTMDTKAHLLELTAQVKKLQEMVEALPKPEPAPDLKPIQDKVDDLSKAVAAATPLVEKVEKLEGHVGDIGKQIESLEANVLSVKQGIGAISRKPVR